MKKLLLIFSLITSTGILYCSEHSQTNDSQKINAPRIHFSSIGFRVFQVYRYYDKCTRYGECDSLKKVIEEKQRVIEKSTSNYLAEKILKNCLQFSSKITQTEAKRMNSWDFLECINENLEFYSSNPGILKYLILRRQEKLKRQIQPS